MTKWKYLVRTNSQFPYLDEENGLNYLGDQGWELVQHVGDKYIFKKPLEEIEPF